MKILGQKCRIDLLPDCPPALIEVTIGWWSLALGVWGRPGLWWNKPGYDCIWTEWALYPLFHVEAVDAGLHGEWTKDD